MQGIVFATKQSRSIVIEDRSTLLHTTHTISTSLKRLPALSVVKLHYSACEPFAKALG